MTRYNVIKNFMHVLEIIINLNFVANLIKEKNDLLFKYTKYIFILHIK